VTDHPSHRNPWLVLAGFVAVVAIVAVVARLAATSADQVRAKLELPAWTPPAEVAGPLWTVLYVTVAVAGWCYWRTDGETSGFAAYGISLLFNLLWTPLFIAGGSARLALVDLVALDIALLVTIVLFARRSRLAAGLLVPYLGWLWFITALNATVVALN